MNPVSNAGTAIVHQESCSRRQLLSTLASGSPWLLGTVCLLRQFPLVFPLFTLICAEQNKYINEKELRLTDHKFTAKGRLAPRHVEQEDITFFVIAALNEQRLFTRSRV